VKHLARILSVVLPILVAVASTTFATPAVTNFLAAHPADAGYVLLVAGVLRAAYKAYSDRKADAAIDPPASGGSSMGAV
jgi:hypothetical protein